MAIGLNRTKNLSEQNLNLKEALQKLYAPGIEDDLGLFSLSSTLESVVISGPEESSATIESQIYAIASEKLRLADESVVNRTKFLTKFYTYTDDNLIYFSNLNISIGPNPNATAIKYSNGGSVPTTKITYGGQGFYFLNTDGTVYDAGDSITVKGVTLVGTESGANSIRADITLQKTPDATGNTDYITNFTPGSIKRYAISSINITTEGNGYIVPERLSVSIDEEVQEDSNETTIVLKKQNGNEFAFTDPIILSDLYYYRVINAKDDSFFLFDDILNKYVFLDANISSLDIKDIDLRRYDGIKVDNFTPFKFAQSTVYLRSYLSNIFSLGDSISGAINSAADDVSFLNQRKEKAVLNTRRPTPTTSEENNLGYTYNSFEGDDVVIWQRVVIRDQDFILDSSDPEITGNALKDSVDNFRLTKADNSEIPIPGLFIKVGRNYFRAFSTTDKPFLFPNNPNADGELSAEGYLSNTWYAHDTIIAQLAQRIDPAGTNGAFYFHRSTAPEVRSVAVKKGETNATVYATPLFRLA